VELPSINGLMGTRGRTRRVCGKHGRVISSSVLFANPYPLDGYFNTWVLHTFPLCETLSDHPQRWSPAISPQPVFLPYWSFLLQPCILKHRKTSTASGFPVFLKTVPAELIARLSALVRYRYSFKNADEAAKWGADIQELRRSYEASCARFLQCSSYPSSSNQRKATQSAFLHCFTTANTRKPQCLQKGDPQVEAQLAEMYKMWMGKFGKDRSSKERAAGNEGAFIANLWKAGEINLKSPNTGWWASMNAFADM
jgi:hypothetical protein